jgi:hypothetical protein
MVVGGPLKPPTPALAYEGLTFKLSSSSTADPQAWFHEAPSRRWKNTDWRGVRKRAIRKGGRRWTFRLRGIEHPHSCPEADITPGTAEALQTQMGNATRALVRGTRRQKQCGFARQNMIRYRFRYHRCDRRRGILHSRVHTPACTVGARTVATVPCTSMQLVLQFICFCEKIINHSCLVVL